MNTDPIDINIDLGDTEPASMDVIDVTLEETVWVSGRTALVTGTFTLGDIGEAHIIAAVFYKDSHIFTSLTVMINGSAGSVDRSIDNAELSPWDACHVMLGDIFNPDDVV